MNPTSEIFGKVLQYLNYQLNLEELEDWVETNMGWFLALPLDTPSELASAIELGLMEMMQGHRDEDEFRALLQEFIASHRTQSLRFPVDEPISLLSSTNTTQPISFIVELSQPRYESRSLEMASS